VSNLKSTRDGFVTSANRIGDRGEDEEEEEEGDPSNE
jgi:hypothetical protein